MMQVEQLVHRCYKGVKTKDGHVAHVRDTRDA
jgi:hypothetical protein